LKDAFGDRAANVLLNYWLFLPQAGGVWDAAFEETGNRPAGFDFKGSPFGEEPFDMFPFRPKLKGELRYRDVFTGFVFVNPVNSQFLENGVPGFHKGFEDEALRRAALVSDDYVRTTKERIAAEKRGAVPVKSPLSYRFIESLLELSMLGIFGVGALIGLAAFAWQWRHAKRQQAETGKNV